MGGGSARESVRERRGSVGVRLWDGASGAGDVAGVGVGVARAAGGAERGGVVAAGAACCCRGCALEAMLRGRSRGASRCNSRTRRSAALHGGADRKASRVAPALRDVAAGFMVISTKLAATSRGVSEWPRYGGLHVPVYHVDLVNFVPLHSVLPIILYDIAISFK